MLALSRKVGETIDIGTTIRIVVRKIHGNRVVLGVEAPQSVRITRPEKPELKDDHESQTGNSVRDDK